MRNPKDIRKYASILVLRELLQEAPIITFTNIFAGDDGDGTFNLIWELIRDKNDDIRHETLKFFDEAIKQISARELKMQNESNWLLKIYTLIKRGFQATELNAIIGNIVILKCLLKYSGSDTFIQHMVTIAHYILKQRKLSDINIKRAVIESLPALARYNPGVFATESFSTAFKFLIKETQNRKMAANISVCYKTLSSIFSTVNKQFLKKKVKVLIKNLN